MKNVNFKPSSNFQYVSIIILNYNGASYLADCLESVFKTVGCKFEVILIDNGSTDNSAIICKEKFPEIKLIQVGKNLGMEARNIGREKARGDFIVFLDGDTVVEPDWLSNLLHSYYQNREGLYQAKLLDKQQHDIINSCGNLSSIFGLGFSRGKGEKDNGQYDNFQTISFTSGACTFASSETMKKIGETVRIFFNYHDDLDFGWRAWSLDIPSYFEPKSIIYHLGSPTFKWTKEKFFLLERNRWICLLTLYSTKTLVKIFPFLILVEIGVFIFFLSKGLGIAKIKSFISLFKMHGDIKKRRKEMVEKRVLTDKELISKFAVDDFSLPPNLAKGLPAKLFKFIIVFLSRGARTIVNL